MKIIQPGNQSMHCGFLPGQKRPHLLDKRYALPAGSCYCYCQYMKMSTCIPKKAAFPL